MIDLKGLLSAIVSAKPMTINLFDENGLLLISFVMDGYPCLEDVLETDPVTKIEIKSLTTLNITIDTSENP